MMTQQQSEQAYTTRLDPVEFALALEIEGYSMTFHRIGELFMSGELTVPAESDGVLFGERNLQQAREACDKRRWWIPMRTEFDERRTPVEMRYVQEFRQAALERVEGLKQLSVAEILNHMMSEPSLEMRRIYRAVIAHRYEEDVKQAKGANHG